MTMVLLVIPGYQSDCTKCTTLVNQGLPEESFDLLKELVESKLYLNF